ncbi:MAG: ankyrin repeat domain-containing protein [Proteobacteria bacterium]|nr:ankyrin repeat domain-containing protein [Pseudomonadota bacterium]
MIQATAVICLAALLGLYPPAGGPRDHGGVFRAALQGRLAAVQSLVRADPKIIHARDKRLGATPLAWAAWGKQRAVAAWLLAKGAKVDARDRFGFTPLHRAADGGGYEVAVVLVNQGADVNAKSVFRYTPLHFAAKYDRPRIAALLIERGARLEDRDKARHRTALAFAAEFGSLKTARVLIKRGADVTARDAKGVSMVQYARRKHYLGGVKSASTIKALVELLRRHGAR